MLQLSELNRRAFAELASGTWPPAWRTMVELEACADDAVAQLKGRRERLASSRYERLSTWIDRRLACRTTEYLDRPDHPEERKLSQVRWLHVQNLALRAYQRFLRELEPHIADAAARRPTGRARILELASGSGEMTLALERVAARMKLPVEITGSDVVRAYVGDANRRAEREGLAARFRVLNAFDLSSIERGAFDVVFVVQSMHHFTAGQLAMMIAQVGAIGARAFVGIDGRRSLFLVGALPLLGALTLNRYFAHDALVSARRLYSDAELGLVARIAAPDAEVDVRASQPGLSVLSVRYASGEV